jgi:C4-dicarboxylate transporter
VALGLVGWLLAKRVNATVALLLVGVLLMLASVALGHAGSTSLEPQETGNAVLDQFAYISAIFADRAASTGMIIMVLFGFSSYMTQIGANAVAVDLLTKPLLRIGPRGRYLLVPLTFWVGNLMSLVVPSASSLAVLLMATLFPTMVAAGISRMTSAAVIATTATIMPTPLGADNVVAADKLGVDLNDYTWAMHAKISVPTLIVMGLVHYVWQRFMDARDLARSVPAGAVAGASTAVAAGEEATANKGRTAKASVAGGASMVAVGGATAATADRTAGANVASDAGAGATSGATAAASGGAVASPGQGRGRAATAAGSGAGSAEGSEGGQTASDGETVRRAPKFYCVFPLLPLVLVLAPWISERVGGPQINLSLVPVVLISLLIGMVTEILVGLTQKRSPLAAMDDAKVFFKGMGEGMTTVVGLLIGAAVLVEGITKLGVIDTLVRWASDMPGGTGIVIAAFVLLMLVLTLLTGGVAPFYSFVEAVPGVAAGLGINGAWLTLPLQFVGNLGRACSPVAAVVLIVSGYIKVAPVALIKRTAVPMAAGMVMSLALTWVLI